MDDKLILQELKAIKRALTCGGSIGGSNSDTNLALDTFQIYNCSEEPVGSPQDVLKTVVLNTTTTNICNVQELIDGLNTQVNYNNVTQYEAEFNSPVTITGNTVHSISYKILTGSVDITIGTNTLNYIIGEGDGEEATTLIQQTYIFTPLLGGKVKIKTIN